MNASEVEQQVNVSLPLSLPPSTIIFKKLSHPRKHGLGTDAAADLSQTPFDLDLCVFSSLSAGPGAHHPGEDSAELHHTRSRCPCCAFPPPMLHPITLTCSPSVELCHPAYFYCSPCISLYGVLNPGSGCCSSHIRQHSPLLPTCYRVEGRAETPRTLTSLPLPHIVSTTKYHLQNSWGGSCLAYSNISVLSLVPSSSLTL